MRTLATLLLLATLSGCTGGDPPKTSPSPSPSATPAAAPGDGLEDLPVGPPPRIAYVDDGEVVHPDGRRERLVGQRRIGVTAFTRLRDGYLVADGRTFEGTVGLAHVAGRQRTDLGPCATGAGVRRGDRTEVAWVTMGCPESNQTGPTVVHVADSVGDGGWSRSLGRQYLFFAAGFLGDAVVISSWTGQVLVVPGSGPVTTVPRLRHAADTHGTLVAGSKGVVDTATGELLWHDPDIDLVSFSPGGRLLVGYRHGSVVVLEARTGHRVSTLPDRPEQLTWEDDRHLLGVMHRGERQVMVRIGIRGRAALVGPVVPDSAYRFVFETQP